MRFIFLNLIESILNGSKGWPFVSIVRWGKDIKWLLHDHIAVVAVDVAATTFNDSVMWRLMNMINRNIPSCNRTIKGLGFVENSDEFDVNLFFFGIGSTFEFRVQLILYFDLNCRNVERKSITENKLSMK